jgi:transketolase
MMTRYVVRDIATQGCDFLLWGDGDEHAAQVSLAQALADGLEVELVSMPANGMDEHTARLIEGD